MLLARTQEEPVLVSCRERPSTRFRCALRRAICAASAWRSRTRLRAPEASARCTARCTKDSSRNSTRSARSPSTRTITSQRRRDPHSICEYSEYPEYLAQPRTASCRLWSVLRAIAELCLQAIGENGNTVCMRKLVRRLPRAAAAAASSCEPCVRSLWRPRQHRWDRRLDRWRHRRRHRPRSGTRG